MHIKEGPGLGGGTKLGVPILIWTNKKPIKICETETCFKCFPKITSFKIKSQLITAETNSNTVH